MGTSSCQTCWHLLFGEHLFLLWLFVAWAGQRKKPQICLLPLLPQELIFHPSSTLQVQPSDSLEPEFTRKCQSLLKRWREKVFALMVQLKAQELEHRGCVEQLKGQVT